MPKDPQPVIVAADGHFHVYPEHDIGALFSFLAGNLSGIARAAAEDPEAVRIAFLAESRGHDFFSLFYRGEISGGLEITDARETICATVSVPGKGRVIVIAGRQIVTAERLEILGLAMRETIPCGLPAGETVCRIKGAGGVPVLAWAMGKWAFSRARPARNLVSMAPSSGLRVGDSSLRPVFSPEPPLMKLARGMGTGIIPGSDPLPFSGDERYAGSYGFVYEGGFDVSRVKRSIDCMFGDSVAGSGGKIRPAGTRCGPWSSARRLFLLRATSARRAGRQ